VLEIFLDQEGSDGIFYSGRRLFSRTSVECHLVKTEPRARTVQALANQEAGEIAAGVEVWLA